MGPSWTVNAREPARPGAPIAAARPLARVIQTEVRDPLTDEILFGRLENGGTVRIRLEGDALAFAISPAAPPQSAPPAEPARVH